DLDRPSLPYKEVPINFTMTPLQKKYIQKEMQKFRYIVDKKAKLFQALSSIIPSAIPINDITPSYTNFLFKTKDKKAALDATIKHPIRLRETWPAFQPYWDSQYSPEIKELKDRYLLVTLAQYLDQELQHKLLNFFDEHKNLFDTAAAV
ncbi:MAG: hypothetical protein KGJ59_12395, partial [Bacteroidota bacterium]|nr:hypothetical protein [Bacteroidota bacterium]